MNVFVLSDNKRLEAITAASFERCVFYVRYVYRFILIAFVSLLDVSYEMR